MKKLTKKERLTLNELWVKIQKEAKEKHGIRIPDCLYDVVLGNVEKWRKSFYK
jgi:hypothetical protein